MKFFDAIVEGIVVLLFMAPVAFVGLLLIIMYEKRAQRKESVENTRQKRTYVTSLSPLRDDDVLDLELFRAVEALLGEVNWKSLLGIPSYARWFPPLESARDERFDARAKLSEAYAEHAWLREHYPRAAFERDCEVLFRPDHPIFIAPGDEPLSEFESDFFSRFTNDKLIEKIKVQGDTLAWILFVFAQAGEILGLRSEHSLDVPNGMTRSALIAYFKEFLSGDRSKARERVVEISTEVRQAALRIRDQVLAENYDNQTNLSEQLRKRRSKAEKREEFLRLLSEAKHHLNLRYFDLVHRLGAVLSKVEYEEFVSNAFARASNAEQITNATNDVRDWLRRLELCQSVRQTFKGSSHQPGMPTEDEVEQYIKEFMPLEAPINVVSEAADRIKERITFSFQSHSETENSTEDVRPSKKELIRRREAVFADYDANIDDDLQRARVKEQRPDRSLERGGVAGF